MTTRACNHQATANNKGSEYLQCQTKVITNNEEMRQEQIINEDMGKHALLRRADAINIKKQKD